MKNDLPKSSNGRVERCYEPELGWGWRKVRMETKITYLAVLNPKTEKLANCALFFMFRPTYRSGVGDAMMVSMQMFREVCIPPHCIDTREHELYLRGIRSSEARYWKETIEGQVICGDGNNQTPGFKWNTHTYAPTRSAPSE